jgi:hypothetical protein
MAGAVVSALVLFKCCPHCPPAHANSGPDEHEYPCPQTDDDEPCEQGSQHAEEEK